MTLPSSVPASAQYSGSARSRSANSGRALIWAEVPAVALCDGRCKISQHRRDSAEPAVSVCRSRFPSCAQNRRTDDVDHGVRTPTQPHDGSRRRTRPSDSTDQLGLPDRSRPAGARLLARFPPTEPQGGQRWLPMIACARTPPGSRGRCRRDPRPPSRAGVREEESPIGRLRSRSPRHLVSWLRRWPERRPQAVGSSLPTVPGAVDPTDPS